MPEDFAINLLKVVAAELFYLCGMQTSREMFGKGYFSLGVSEKIAVDQAVLSMVSANFQTLTPEMLRVQKGQGVGFQTQTTDEKK